MEQKIKAILQSKGTTDYKAAEIMRLMVWFSEQQMGKALLEETKTKY